jgi:WD40 repeat protein
MLGTTSRKQLIVYRYNPSGCITSLKYRTTLDSICFTSKAPILIFTGDTNGYVLKWEQRPSNQLIYNSENLIKSESVLKESSKMLGQAKPNQLNNNVLRPVEVENETKLIKRTNVVLKLLYVESADLLLAACEDASIYVWGFDEEAVKILKNMKMNDDNNKLDENNIKNYRAYLKNLMNNNGEDLDALRDVEEEEDSAKKDESDSVTNRVAGLILKKVLSEHTSCVTSLVVVEKVDEKTRYLLSAGWDRRICIWNLDQLRLYDLFRNKTSSTFVNNYEEIELASDGNILDMCYCQKMDVFAYASTDSMVYIRKFAIHGSEMVLVNTLQGHMSDVNCVKWLESKCNWVTGGEDNTVRIWVSFII